MMRRTTTTLLTAAAMIVAAGAATAADITVVEPVFEPPPAVQPTPFDGFYLGGHAGYGWANRSGCVDFFDFPVEDCDEDDFDYDQNGWLAGAQVGYNHVFNGMSPQFAFLLGLEVTGSLSGITGNLDVGGDAYDGVGDWTYLATATAKAGVVWERVLLYAEGGLALGGFRFNASACNFDSTHQGWLAGGGAEVEISPNNSIFVEYNYLDFGTKDASCGVPVIGPAVQTDSSIHVVRFGFNHFFN